MSGEPNFAMDDEDGKLSERIKRIEDKWDEFETKQVFGRHNDIRKYLDYNYSQIQNLTPEQAGEIGTYFALFSVHLQKIIGKHQARINYCDANIRILCSKQAHNYNGYTYKERCDQVLANNEFGITLDKLRRESQYVLDRLSYLPAKLEFFSKTLESSQKYKLRKERV